MNPCTDFTKAGPPSTADMDFKPTQRLLDGMQIQQRSMHAEILTAIQSIPATIQQSPNTLQADAISAIQQIPKALQNLADAVNAQRVGTNGESQSDGRVGMTTTSTLVRKHKEQKQIQVHVSLSVRRVFNISTVGQTFGVQVCLIMMWECPEMEAPPLPEEDDGDWVPKWTPNYRMRRMMEEIQCESRFFCRVADGRRWVYAEHNHLLHIFEELELHSFPSDCQDLCVEALSTSPMEAVRWVPMTSDEPFVEMDTSQFFGNDLMLLSLPFTYKLYTITLQHHSTSCLQVNIKVVRKSFFYVVNVILVMFVLCTLVLCAWQVHPADIEARQAVDFNLILTIVAFKLILASMLPPVNYVTMLDCYVLFGFLYVTGATLVHSVLPWRCIEISDNSPLSRAPATFDEEELLDRDAEAWFLFMGIWGGWNFCYTVAFYLHSQCHWRSKLAEAKADQIEFDKIHKTLADTKLSSKGFQSASSSLREDS